MQQFHITDENSEDTFDSVEKLEDAIRIARKIATTKRIGESVCIEYQGKNIRQFVLLPDGKVAEEALV